jgi:2,3-bisphosphoglycerate-independent phosphoglycerate mutase
MIPYERCALLILDGWGIGPDPAVSAIAQAETPVMDRLLGRFPHTELVTHGEAVGLPAGQMGNSEVGHLNIGAGRVVYQELERINVAVRQRELHENPELLDAFEYAKMLGKSVHLMGLVSDGGVHSHIEHLKALCDIAAEQGLQKVFVHAFLDGRDTSPTGGVGYLADLQRHLAKGPARIASVIGRYYAMDRDNRWERVKLAYDLIVHGDGVQTDDPIAQVQQSYAEGITDEFVRPIVVCDRDSEPLAVLEDGDVVLCFNFRTDRCREITIALTQEDKREHGMECIPLYYLTMTRYDETFEGVHVLFEKDDLSDTLGEVLSKAGKTQFRVAETEKYPHVTFFFSGGREEPFAGERRAIVPSPKVATYDLQPEMSAAGVTEAALAEIRAHRPDFICLNYANADMVGHTGVFSAAVKAAETVDACLGRLLDVLLENGYAVLIIADHGNSDFMVNPDGTPNTAHTTNPVPCLFVADDTQGLRLRPGKLGDLAPTILTLLGLETPEAMTGEVLVGG